MQFSNNDTSKDRPSTSFPQNFEGVVKRLESLSLIALTIFFVIRLGQSLSWRIWGDGAVLHYFAYLINEHNFIPYRDIFDPNMPGAYLFHMLIGNVFGYSKLAFRMVDLTWLAATLAVTWLLMKPFGRVVSYTSSLLFGVVYLTSGPYMALQRDAIVILPLSVALLLATRPRSNLPVNLTCFLIGVLFALMALFKPHLAIGLPAVLIYSYLNDGYSITDIKEVMRVGVIRCLFASAGFLLMMLLPFLWLWQIGSLDHFWTIFTSYTPLYAQMSRDLEFRAASGRLLNIIYWYINFGGFSILLLASIVGVHFVFVMKQAPSVIKRQAIFLLLLSILYSLSVAIGGKLWYYHWMPYVYIANLCVAMLLYSAPSPSAWTTFNRNRPSALLLFIFIVSTMTVLVHSHTYNVEEQLGGGKSAESSRQAEADEITAYLNEHLSATDKVQSLDWTGAALPGLFNSRAVIATPYIFDFQFYHHVSTPYIQGLRHDFLARLTESPPTFIIEVDQKFSVSGLDTTDDFPELREFVEQHYQHDYAGNGFDVFRRNDG